MSRASVLSACALGLAAILVIAAAILPLLLAEAEGLVVLAPWAR